MAVPLSSVLPSAPPTEGALYPFGWLEVRGALVTTRTMVTGDWVGFWSTWMGWTWPPPPGTKARAFPGPEGWGGAAMMTCWPLTGEPTQRQMQITMLVYVKAFVCVFQCIVCRLTWGTLRVPVLRYRCQFVSQLFMVVMGDRRALPAQTFRSLKPTGWRRKKSLVGRGCGCTPEK